MHDEIHDELHRHAASLRGLARDLLRDAHAADDVTQATLQRALTHPPLQPGPLGGWLHRTLVNFVRQWRRSERRRAAHEVALPARAVEPAAAEALARREMLRAVTDAVLRLDEPYQTAIFLRYFEDLPPRAIARRTASNVATVKSRLARGLVMLRARLDDGGRERTWRPALACAFGLPLSTLLPLPAGALLVSTTTKVLCVAGVLCASGLFALGLGDDPLPASATSPAAGDSAATAAAAAVPPVREQATERAAATAPVTDEPWLEHPFEMRIDVLVVDPLGLPVEGHQLQVAPVGCTLNHADDRTNAEGRAVVAWRARTSRMEVELREPRDQLRRITVEHGKPARLVLLGNPSTGDRVYAYTRARVKSLALTETRLADVRLGDGVDLTMRGGLHPHARFTDQCAHVTEAPAANALVNTEVVLTVAALDHLVRSNVRVNEVLALQALKARSGAPELQRVIAGTVFGEDGKPAAQVPVVLLGTSPQPLQRTATDEQGRFRFDTVAGEFTVRAGGDHNGLATAPAIVTTGITPATLQLQRGACVRGRALDPEGKPLASTRVEWRAHDGSGVDATTTRDDGTFVLANLPVGTGSVSLSNEQSGHRLPLATLPSVLPDTGELLLRAAPANGSTLKVEPIDAIDNGNLTFHVWQTETGVGATIGAPHAGAAWAMHCLPAGFYEVEVRAAGGGRRHLGRHWLDGSAPCDLGRVAVPPAGEVVFALRDGDLPADPGQRAFELIALRADADVRVAPARADRPLQLPPGNYAFGLRRADGTIQFRHFTVTAGRTTTVTSAQ